MLLVGFAILGAVCIGIFVKKVTSSRSRDMPEQSAEAWGLEAGPPALLTQAQEKSESTVLDVHALPSGDVKPQKIDVWKTEEERVRRLWRES
jgi:hypothetical protein